jgi:hypothetical protein
MFVELDEIADGQGQAAIFGGTERIDPQSIFKPCYNNSDTERVETRFHQDKVIGKRRQFLSCSVATFST